MTVFILHRAYSIHTFYQVVGPSLPLRAKYSHGAETSSLTSLSHTLSSTPPRIMTTVDLASSAKVLLTTSNWHVWMPQMRRVLRKVGLWGHITAPTPVLGNVLRCLSIGFVYRICLFEGSLPDKHSSLGEKP